MAKAKILLVEDEEDLVRVLKVFLLREGHEFFHALNGLDGLAAVRAHKPDLVLLDISLPDVDGLTLLQVLRRESSVPVVFLTGKGSELDRIRGLQLGADDYVVKPFSIPELMVRIKVILTRTRASRVGDLFRAGGLEVDLERMEVRVNGRYRELAPREFQVLRLLIEADGKVVPRERVLEALWGAEEGLEVSTRIVDQHVARLRGKLLTERTRIVTIQKFGYRLRLD